MGQILAVLVTALMLPTAAGAASKYKVLHRFKNDPDGATPWAGLIFDTAGDLYGTTKVGGAGLGTVFKLTPNANGSWTESVLYSFTGGGDGAEPLAGLTFDTAGNLYGTTTMGGGSTNCTGGCGTVFELTPNSNGTWTENVLHSFTGADGGEPYAGLTFDTVGNLYGTTLFGGTKCFNCGTVFKLTPNADGSWTESVLYSFANGTDGAYPSAVLVFDAGGNLYGTTGGGGNNSKCANCGTVFELKPNPDGTWTEHVLHRFTDGKDGSSPDAGLIFDPAGNLYGTNVGTGNPSCAAAACGVVFELNTSHKFSVVHTFANHRGFYPYAGLISDANGNLYGTTVHSAPVDGGVVFKLAPRSGGGWTYSLLHVFQGTLAVNPYGGLVLGITGNLYGTTSQCGSGTGCSGVVFGITP
jgi:uncharacterized repeat protein (TIGR03803 family)